MLGHTKRILLTVSATLSILLLFRVITISPVIVEKMVSWATYPCIVTQNYIVTPLQHMMQRRKNAEELSALLLKRDEEVEQLRAENYALKATESHAREVAEMMSFADRYKTDHMVLAQIILKQFSHDHHFFMVNAGSNRGILKDMVAVYNNCLVGRVVEVYPWYSKVLLITDRLCKVPVMCANTHTQGIHEGENNLSRSKLEFVSHLQPLKQGDLLISSGDGFVYPKGFAVGTIAEFSLNSMGLNYIVSVVPALPFRELTHCYLVAKGAEYCSAPA